MHEPSVCVCYTYSLHLYFHVHVHSSFCGFRAVVDGCREEMHGMYLLWPAAMHFLVAMQMHACLNVGPFSRRTKFSETISTPRKTVSKVLLIVPSRLCGMKSSKTICLHRFCLCSQSICLINEILTSC